MTFWKTWFGKTTIHLVVLVLLRVYSVFSLLRASISPEVQSHPDCSEASFTCDSVLMMSPHVTFWLRPTGHHPSTPPAICHPFSSSSVTVPHLVLGIHLGHHTVLQQVEGEHLQHVQLVGHLVVDGCGAPDHILHGVEDKQRTEAGGRWKKGRGE